jgi:hypothetical protein
MSNLAVCRCYYIWDYSTINEALHASDTERGGRLVWSLGIGMRTRTA